MRSRQSLEVLDDVFQGRLHSILSSVVRYKIDQLCLQAGRLKVTPIEIGDHLHLIDILCHRQRAVTGGGVNKSTTGQGNNLLAVVLAESF